jgi:hypothetical protein
MHSGLTRHSKQFCNLKHRRDCPVKAAMTV